MVAKIPNLVDVGDLLIVNKTNTPMMVMRKYFTRRFEFQEGASDKFWEIQLEGSSNVVHYGRRGSTGTTNKQQFGSDYEAKREYEKKVNEKIRKGYAETENKYSYICLNPGGAGNKKQIVYSDNDIRKAIDQKTITIKKRGLNES